MKRTAVKRETVTESAPVYSENVGRVLEDLHAVALAAEEIIWNLVPGQFPSAAERKILGLMKIRLRDEFDIEVGRVGAVKDLMRDAGGRDEYLAADKAAFEARREESEKRPALEQQLAAIQSELDALAAARAAADARVGKMTVARKRLREPRLMPIHIREAIEADQIHTATKHHKRRSELESELASIDGLLKLTGGQHWNAIQLQRQRLMHAEVAAPEIIGRKVNGQAHIEEIVWADYVRMRAAKRPAIERELAKVNERIIDDSYDCERLRNFYVDQIA